MICLSVIPSPSEEGNMRSVGWVEQRETQQSPPEN
jgi:hypothetical protein